MSHQMENNVEKQITKSDEPDAREKLSQESVQRATEQQRPGTQKTEPKPNGQDTAKKSLPDLKLDDAKGSGGSGRGEYAADSCEDKDAENVPGRPDDEDIQQRLEELQKDTEGSGGGRFPEGPGGGGGHFRRGESQPQGDEHDGMRSPESSPEAYDDESAQERAPEGFADPNDQYNSPESFDEPMAQENEPEQFVDPIYEEPSKVIEI